MELIDLCIDEIKSFYKTINYDNIKKIIQADIDWFFSDTDDDFLCYRLTKNDTIGQSYFKIRMHHIGLGKDCKFDSVSLLICDDICNQISVKRKFNPVVDFLPNTRIQLYKLEEKIREKLINLYRKLFIMYKES